MRKQTILFGLLLIFYGVCGGISCAYAGGHGGGYHGHGGHGYGGGYHGHGWYGYGGGYWGYPAFSFYFGAPYYGYPLYGYPSYGYPSYAYPYYYPPGMITAPSSPPVYIQQNPPSAQQNPPGYWYYCNDPQGYYPDVKECPGGWQQVEPTPPPTR